MTPGLDKLTFSSDAYPMTYLNDYGPISRDELRRCITAAINKANADAGPGPLDRVVALTELGETAPTVLRGACETVDGDKCPIFQIGLDIENDEWNFAFAMAFDDATRQTFKVSPFDYQPVPRHLRVVD
jgi:hypothetical protein